MKIRLTVERDYFGLGFDITRGSRIALGLGPIMLGVYWGPMLWKCPQCEQTTERLYCARCARSALAQEKPPGATD